ncbi:U-box domain-containing protein 35 [Rosa chinensis]|uniref:U-box domain-containing protein 35 n=1 Tax=Rosa chinensis TaxID=74649 RepID=UPI000D0885A1|nr:U-box domain-containing protein 35 [Rosa chinensis]
MAFLRSSSVAQDTGPTLVAIDKDKHSHFAVKWAVDNLIKTSKCILIHVRNKSLHPQDAAAIPKEGRPPTEAELQQFFLPYRGFCARKGIIAMEVVLHDIDVPSALVHYIIHNAISNIVVGASHRNALTRKFKDFDVPSSLLKYVPDTCAVYVISSKGRLQAKRAASQPQTPKCDAEPLRDTSQENHLPSHPHDGSDSEDIPRSQFSHGSSSSKSASSDRISFDRLSDFKPITPHKMKRSTNSPTLSVDSSASETSSHRYSLSGSDSSGPLSFQSNGSDNEGNKNSLSSQTQSGLDGEMMRLRQELKQTMDMYTSACKEALASKQKAWELQKWKTAKERKLEEAKLAEEAAVALAEKEKQKSKAAIDAARMAHRLAEMETQKRKIAEMRAKEEAKERRKAMEALAQNKAMYRRYSIEEIEVATDYFNISNKVGEGGYGPVYKGLLNHTPVAIKVLRPDISQGKRQFQQEVEVLSCIRHPHMVLLVGTCPEYGCLVYEYMENGSLEDRLFQKDNTPPIPWTVRFKIAAEIATGLLFLHQTKPEPIVHRDLKPANILLDRNCVSKIADVGLSRLVPASVADSVTQYRLTAAAGTFCYIDPEYQKTGMLGVKSDIYSLGIMLLQILTSKPAMALSHQVEESIEKGTFAELLDPAVPDWPVEEALSLAKLALKCCELRRRDRPDLGSVILPELDRLREFGNQKEANNYAIVPYRGHSHASLPPVPVGRSTTNASQEGMRENPNVEMGFQRRSM